MTTVIKSADTLSDKSLAVDVGGIGQTTYMRTYRQGADGRWIVVHTAELLAALDAEPKSVAEGLRKLEKQLRAEVVAVVAARDVARDQAERMENQLRRVEKLNRDLVAKNVDLASRAAENQKKAERAWDQRDHQTARAEAAEAKLAEAERIAHEADVALTGVYERLSTAEAKLAAAVPELQRTLVRLAAVTAERDELREELLSTEMGRAGLEAERDALLAERDAHAATIGRVRSIAERYNSSALALSEIRAALAPKPAFVLPTEAGAGVMARSHEATDDEFADEFRLYSDGLWRGISWDRSRTPEELLADFTDHRLLDGAE